MKSKFFLLLLGMMVASTAVRAQQVGVLKAYYAKVDFQGYHKGQLIVDTNDPINRMVSKNATTWKYEGNETGEYYSHLLPKKNVTVKIYKMHQLTVQSVGKKAVFRSKEGKEIRIFLSHLGDHKYYNWDGTEVNAEATERHKQCYVISAFYGDNMIYEDPLEVENGCIKLYQKSRYHEPRTVRSRPGKIGMLEEQWFNTDKWEWGKSAYDADGNRLIDSWEAEGIPEMVSIAYIKSLDALYFCGTLYYRQK
ncbi:MAG: hypothetical protein Q4B68_10565 [Bacteroidales bacterium]|nr:hypothetical protein [Bacteroidales bacterium]